MTLVQSKAYFDNTDQGDVCPVDWFTHLYEALNVAELRALLAYENRCLKLFRDGYLATHGKRIAIRKNNLNEFKARLKACKSAICSATVLTSVDSIASQKQKKQKLGDSSSGFQHKKATSTNVNKPPVDDCDDFEESVKAVYRTK
ncbi:hypothetical protein HDU78_009244 [Chytriomyces hyalinus]|nr:hypothetical protein HDU78_009244 [Chytriomyces hyalinus]